MADEHRSVDRERVVDASPDADGACPSAEDDIGQADILCHHHIGRRDGGSNREVCRIGTDADLEDVCPEAPVGMRRILRAAGIVGPKGTLQILGSVSGDDAGHLLEAGTGQGLPDDGAGICIDIDPGHVLPSSPEPSAEKSRRPGSHGQPVWLPRRK